MSENNVDLFNEATARLFAELYRHFPVRIPVSYQDITGTKSTGQLVMEDGVSRQTPIEEDIHDATVEWLAGAGYIDLNGNAISGDATLSYKGLEVLKLVPGKLAGDSFGDALISSAGKGAAGSAAGALASEALSTAFRTFAWYTTGG